MFNRRDFLVSLGTGLGLTTLPTVVEARCLGQVFGDSHYTLPVSVNRIVFEQVG